MARAADRGTDELGQKIRELRTASGLTLDVLAREAGVSRSLISQVERGVASPSITTLRGIAAALGVPMAALFLDADAPLDGLAADEDERRIVVRAGRRKRLHAKRSRIEYELLTPDLARRVEFLRGELAPGSSGPPEPGAYVAHEGEENVYVESGSVVFLVGEREHELAAGDSISFDCSIPHRVENRGDVPAVMIIAITPPTF